MADKEEKKEKPKEKEKEKEEKEIEDWNEDSTFVKITDDGGITKKIMKEGIGVKPVEGNEVKINYTAKYRKAIFDKNEENKPFSVKIGAHSALKGVEIGVKTMRVGEIARYIFRPEYAYGNTKISPFIPENSTIKYEMELLEIVGRNAEIDSMSYEDKVEKARLIKEEGVAKFKEGNYKEAKEKFEEAVKYLDKFENKNEEKEKEGCKLYQSVLTNLCNCCNKLKEYYTLITYANLGIKINDQLPKLFYFRAIGYANTTEFDDAEKDIRSLEKLLSEEEKKNAGIEYLRELIEKNKKEYFSRRKKFSKVAFSHDVYKDAGAQKPVPPPTEPNSKNPVVFLDVKIGSNQKKRIKIELFEDKVPKTAKNFKGLCTGEKTITYKGSKIFRIVKNVFLQGGDFEKNDGTGGVSIYGEKFEDENFYYSHSREGLLSMINEGKNTNGSQFFITLRDTTWYDEKHVVFGQVIDGMENVKEIEGAKIDDDDKPEEDIIIENCGEIKDGEEIDPEKMKEILEKERIAKEEAKKKKEEEERFEKEKKEKEKEERDNEERMKRRGRRKSSDSHSHDSDKSDDEEEKKKEEDKINEEGLDEISENTRKNKKEEDKKEEDKKEEDKKDEDKKGEDKKEEDKKEEDKKDEDKKGEDKKDEDKKEEDKKDEDKKGEDKKDEDKKEEEKK